MYRTHKDGLLKYSCLCTKQIIENYRELLQMYESFSFKSRSYLYCQQGNIQNQRLSKAKVNEITPEIPKMKNDPVSMKISADGGQGKRSQKQSKRKRN